MCCRRRQVQRHCIEFLGSIAGVGANHLCGVDLRKRKLTSAHFFWVLAAIAELPIERLEMSGNPWDLDVDGQGNGYQMYVIGLLVGSLKSIDGLEIGDDERTNATEFLKIMLKKKKKTGLKRPGAWESHAAAAAAACASLVAAQRRHSERRGDAERSKIFHLRDPSTYERPLSFVAGGETKAGDGVDVAAADANGADMTHESPRARVEGGPGEQVDEDTKRAEEQRKKKLEEDKRAQDEEGKGGGGDGNLTGILGGGGGKCTILESLSDEDFIVCRRWWRQEGRHGNIWWGIKQVRSEPMPAA